MCYKISANNFPWKCTIWEGTQNKDETNVEAFTAHNFACLEKKKMRYKNQEKPIAKPENQKELKGKKQKGEELWKTIKPKCISLGKIKNLRDLKL